MTASQAAEVEEFCSILAEIIDRLCQEPPAIVEEPLLQAA